MRVLQWIRALVATSQPLAISRVSLERGCAKDRGSVPGLHHAYNDVVREVASRAHWPVLDLAADPLTPDEIPTGSRASRF